MIPVSLLGLGTVVYDISEKCSEWASPTSYVCPLAFRSQHSLEFRVTRVWLSISKRGGASASQARPSSRGACTRRISPTHTEVGSLRGSGSVLSPSTRTYLTTAQKSHLLCRVLCFVHAHSANTCRPSTAPSYTPRISSKASPT
jgi:hypothetical protein